MITTNILLLILTLVALGVPLVFFFMYRKMLTKEPSAEMFSKMIDFLKWYITSVVLVVIVAIIDNGLKEREQGVKEMESFDNYVDIVTPTDTLSLNKRYELAKYLATVLPSKNLRERWSAYLDTLRPRVKKQVLLDSSNNVINKEQNLDSFLKQVKEIKKKLYTDGDNTEKSEQQLALDSIVYEVDRHEKEEQGKKTHDRKIGIKQEKYLSKKDFLIDVFYLESQPKTQQQAKNMELLLTKNGFDARVRKLSDVINSKIGYQVYDNQIRIDKDNAIEKKWADEIQTTIKQKDINTRISETTTQSKGYISVFFVK